MCRLRSNWKKSSSVHGHRPPPTYWSRGLEKKRPEAPTAGSLLQAGHGRSAGGAWIHCAHAHIAWHESLQQTLLRTCRNETLSPCRFPISKGARPRNAGHRPAPAASPGSVFQREAPYPPSIGPGSGQAHSPHSNYAAIFPHPALTDFLGTSLPTFFGHHHATREYISGKRLLLASVFF